MPNKQIDGLNELVDIDIDTDYIMIYDANESGSEKAKKILVKHFKVYEATLMSPMVYTEADLGPGFTLGAHGVFAGGNISIFYWHFGGTGTFPTNARPYYNGSNYELAGMRFRAAVSGHVMVTPHTPDYANDVPLHHGFPATIELSQPLSAAFTELTVTLAASATDFVFGYLPWSYTGFPQSYWSVYSYNFNTTTPASWVGFQNVGGTLNILVKIGAQNITYAVGACPVQATYKVALDSSFTPHFYIDGVEVTGHGAGPISGELLMVTVGMFDGTDDVWLKNWRFINIQ